MTQPDPCVDPSFEVIQTVLNTMRDMFSNNEVCTPRGGAAAEVYLVSGEGAVWDPLGEDCPNPFVWVRLMQRYRSVAFPEPTVLYDCTATAVLALELGVGRCVSVDAEIDWNEVAGEALDGLNDAFLLDRVICLIKGRLKNQQVASDPITPYGPDGGGIVWSTSIYIGITE